MKKVLIYFLCFSLLLGDPNLLAASGSNAPPVINSSSGGNTGYEPWYHYIGNTVNTANGNLYLSAKDISVKAKSFGIEIVRAYNSLNSSNNGPFGYGWTFNYNMYLTEEDDNVDLLEGDGSKHTFTSAGDGNYSSPSGVHSNLTKDVNGFSLKYKDGTGCRFDLSGKLLNTVDKNGNRLTFGYAGGKLTSTGDDSGVQITFNYNAEGRISSIVDPLNRTISYEYDGNGNLIRVTDAMGNTILYFYYGNHYLLSTVDRVGAMLRFSYYAENNKAKEIETSLYNFSTGTYLKSLRLYSIEYYGLYVNVTDALGYTTSIELNESGNPVQITDALGGIWDTGWDSNTMSITSSTDPNGHTYYYAYDAYGNQTSVTDPCSNSTQYEWENIDSSAQYISLLKSTTNALDYNTSYDYDPNGNLTETTDANGNSSYNYYNTYGYVNRKVDFRGNETLYSYDTHGNMIDSNDALGDVRTYAYDAAGRLLSETDPLNHTTTYQYNANDKVVEVNDALGNKTTYNYNAVGSLISTMDPNENETNFSHNIIGKMDKVADALNNETSFTFDRTGNLTKTTDAKGNKTATTYDALGRVISVTDALGNTESRTYDSTGNIISKTDPNGHITRYEYDKLNRRTKMISPLGFETQYTYDAVGNLASKTNAKGGIILYGYDALDRLISTSYPDGNSVSVQYDAVGNVTQVTNTGGPGEITSSSYDKLNRPVSATVNYGPFSKTIGYTYDPVGNRKTMTDPNGGVTTYGYDPLNRLSSITNPSNDTTTYEYDNAGRRIKVNYPHDANATYTYDTANRLLELKNSKSTGEVISRYSYSYDDVGNRLSVTDANESVTSYGYDAIYQLTNITYPDGNTTYTYDGTGNRLTQTVNGAPTSYTYDADNRLLSAGTASYSYDDNGNLIRKTDAGGTTTYQYDYENRLTKVTLPDANQVTYQYSASGDRLSKTTAAETTYYLYDDEDVLIELDAAGVQQARFTHGPGIDEPISMNRSGAVSYYHFDGLGSVTSLTNTTQNVVATYKYDVFGIVKEETGAIENLYKFTSREYDRETTLYYYRARYYDPQAGRFLSKDLLGALGATGLYAYVGNNPVNRADPWGHDRPDWIDRYWGGTAPKEFREKAEQLKKDLIKGAKKIKSRVWYLAIFGGPVGWLDLAYETWDLAKDFNEGLEEAKRQVALEIFERLFIAWKLPSDVTSGSSAPAPPPPKQPPKPPEPPKLPPSPPDDIELPHYRPIGGTNYTLDTLGRGPSTGSIDSDHDGIPDVNDNCPNDYNPGQENSDGDTKGDACDDCSTVSDLSDLDGNCVVNYWDLDRLVNNWLSSGPDIIVVDLTRDNKVNFGDYAIWTSHCPGYVDP